MKTPFNKILLGHGSGGRLMHELINGLLLKKLNNPVLRELSDAARLGYGKGIAFSTDSFVVSPIKFPGGDIGKLAVCGTVNDLVMMGAQPEYLSLALVVEEGLDYAVLEEVVSSISSNAKLCKVAFVTGDTKVVEKGACDKIFINTSGIGRIVKNSHLSMKNISPGDRIIVTGDLGRHGLAVLSQRKGFNLGFGIKSDCAGLNGLLIPVLKKTGAIKFMRDPTRGGVATTLNEIAEGADVGITIEEKNIPLSSKVRAAGELLGIDPLYIANEGMAILVVEKNSAGKTLSLLKKHHLGRKAREIGFITRSPRRQVIIKTLLGTERIVDMLTSEPLPRIC